MARKTVDVEDVREVANKMLASKDSAYRGTPEENAGYRLGVAALLEWVLHESGNYAGYGYQRGNHPAINGKADETRRVYHIKGKPMEGR